MGRKNNGNEWSNVYLTVMLPQLPKDILCALHTLSCGAEPRIYRTRVHPSLFTLHSSLFTLHSCQARRLTHQTPDPPDA